MPEPNQPPHLSDQDLLLAVDGELSPGGQARVEAHLTACWTCRVRKQKLEASIAEFVRFQAENFDPKISPADGPRALLKAQLAQRSETQPPTLPGAWHRMLSWRLSGAVVAIVAAGITFAIIEGWPVRHPASFMAVTVPNPNLTPGATVLLSQRELCMESNANNKAVPVALRKRVFAEYGIASAEPRAYEVDYLITPALGGADDIRNLWPQSYSATVWNAEVKDMLEDHLRGLVCDGQVELATAQREIAGNWIEAYKKYFHTDRPLVR